jgi:hypothetical protein
MIAFYSGELMRPETIRSAFPDGRLIARASVPVTSGAIPAIFAAAVGNVVWGIAVETGVEPGGVEINATTDDGSQLSVVLAESLVSGDPVQVLANARYWELPPEYVNAIAAVVPVGAGEE